MVDWSKVCWRIYRDVDGRRRVSPRDLKPGEMRPTETLVGEVRGVSLPAVRKMLKTGSLVTHMTISHSR